MKSVRTHGTKIRNTEAIEGVVVAVDVDELASTLTPKDRSVSGVKKKKVGDKNVKTRRSSKTLSRQKFLVEQLDEVDSTKSSECLVNDGSSTRTFGKSTPSEDEASERFSRTNEYTRLLSWSRKESDFVLGYIGTSNESVTSTANTSDRTSLQLAKACKADSGRPSIAEYEPRKSRRVSIQHAHTLLEMKSSVLPSWKSDGNKTVRDCALGIIETLEAELKSFPEELDFLRFCLTTGQKDMTLPVALFLDRSSNTGREKRLTMIADACQINVGDLPKFRRRPSHDKRAFAVEKDRGALSSFVLDENESDNPQRLDSKDTPSRVPAWCREATPVECPWMGAPLDRFPVSLPDGLSSQLELALRDFNAWDFDIFKFTTIAMNRPLMFVAWEAFSRNNTFVEFSVHPEKVKSYLALAESMYSGEGEVAFHNNIHAADCVQSVEALLYECHFRHFLDPMDEFGTIFAAVIHDLGHDGKNNNYHVAVQDEVALTYNDISVLENFHVSLGFRLLRDNPEANFVENLRKKQRATFRAEVIAHVLGTDMSRHFEEMSEFNSYVCSCGDRPLDWQEDRTAMRNLRTVLVHAADLSNITKKGPTYNGWKSRIQREFFTQGDTERDMRLPISPLCDRNTVNFNDAQIGFIEFVVEPMFASLIKVGVNLDMPLRFIKDNLDFLTRRKQEATTALKTGAVW